MCLFEGGIRVGRIGKTIVGEMEKHKEVFGSKLDPQKDKARIRQMVKNGEGYSVWNYIFKTGGYKEDEK